jgi:hypothetical protein
MARRSVLLGLLWLAALAVSATPAAAAPPWSTPQTVADFDVRDPALAFNTSSVGLATLRFGAGASRLMTLEAGPAAPAVARRDVGTVVDGPLPYAGTRTLSLRGRYRAGFVTLGYSFGRSGGAVGDVRTLRTIRLRPGEAELAVAPGGSAVIAFAEERRGSTRVWLATRRPSSSRFTTPQIIRGTGSARSLAVSVNDRGRFVVAYVFGSGRTRTVEARIGTVGGSPGRLQTVGRQLGIARLDAIVARTGRTTVAWATHDGGEEQNEPTQLRTNVAPAGRTTFAGQSVLDRAAPGAVATEPAPPSLAAAPDGTTAVGYTLSGRFEDTGTAAGANFVTPARVSVQGRDAAFGTPQELAADGVVGRLAARADGTFAVPYATGVPAEPAPAQLRVSLRAPGATAFGPGEIVADDALQDAAIAFEPGPLGAPVVLYELAGNGGAAISRRQS